MNQSTYIFALAFLKFTEICFFHSDIAFSEKLFSAKKYCWLLLMMVLCLTHECELCQILKSLIFVQVVLTRIITLTNFTFYTINYRLRISRISLYEEDRYFLVWSSTLVLLNVHSVLDQTIKYLSSS